MSNTTAIADDKRRLLIGVPLFIALVLAWGMFWPMMKLALAELPIFSFRFITSAIACAAMFVIAILSGHGLRVPRDQWPALLVAGTFNIGIWFYLSAVGVTELPAGRASLLAYTMPLWSFLISIPMLGERVTTGRIFGVFMGICAVGVLMYDDLTNLGRAPLGVAIMTLAAVCFAFGGVWQKYVQWRIPLLTMAAWQLAIGMVPMAIMGIPEMADLPEMSTDLILILLYCALIGQVFGSAAYFFLVNLLPIKTVSLSLLLTPLVGLSSSALILGEKIGWTEGIAAGLIVTAILTVIPRGENG